MRVTSLLVLASLAAPALASEAGYQLVDFDNLSGIGSPVIPTRVYYPSTTPGLNAPPTPQSGGYPVLVYMHGFGLTASTYATTGEAMAEAGYVCVLPDTGSLSEVVQYEDTQALFPLLVAASTTPGHALEGLIDMGRAGLAGHSMGGNNTLKLLALNQGYQAGIAIASSDQGQGITPNIDVPLLLIHGLGDTAIPWPQSLQTFNQASGFTGSKVFYLFGPNGSHLNVAIGTVIMNPQVFARSIRVQAGFLDCYLGGVSAGLEEVVGPTGTSDPDFNSVSVEVERTELWHVGTPSPGQSVRFEVLCEPGSQSALVASPNQGVTPTVFGTLLIDRNVFFKPKVGLASPNGLLTWTWNVPASLPLGTTRHFQGLGGVVAGTKAFTPYIETIVIQ